MVWTNRFMAYLRNQFQTLPESQNTVLTEKLISETKQNFLIGKGFLSCNFVISVLIFFKLEDNVNLRSLSDRRVDPVSKTQRNCLRGKTLKLGEKFNFRITCNFVISVFIFFFSIRNIYL